MTELSKPKTRTDGDWVILFGGIIGAAWALVMIVLFREYLLGGIQVIMSLIILSATDVFNNRFQRAKDDVRILFVLAVILVGAGGGVGGVLVIFGIIINFIDQPWEEDPEWDEEYYEDDKESE